MNEPIDPDTERRLRDAMRARDAEVNPSDGSLDTMATPSSSSWRRRMPLLVAAAVLVVGGIGAALLLNDDDGDDPDVAVEPPTSSTTEPPPEPTDTEPEDPTTTTTEAPDGVESPDPHQLVADGQIIWPRDSRGFFSAEEAATTYVTEVLGVADPALEVLDESDGVMQMGLMPRGEGGAEGVGLENTLVLVDTEGSWSIVEVATPSLRIDGIHAATGDTAGQLLVLGGGVGFEGSGVLSTTSFCDPGAETTEIVELAATPDAPPVEFATSIAAPQCDVVIVTLTDPAIADGATPAVASRAVRPDTIEPLAIGEATADGLVAATSSLLAALAGDTSAQPPALSSDGVDVGGIGIYADAPTPFVTVDATDVLGDATYDWDPFADDDLGCDPEPCDQTVREFLSVQDSDAAAAEYSIGPSIDGYQVPSGVRTGISGSNGAGNAVSEHGGVDATVTAYLAPADADVDVTDWRTYVVVYDTETDLPVVEAIWLWGWTP